ncbi:MAG TPA: Gldg family protein [Candidatus Bathyarchaeia archaeon]|nr:Gldg family protein [Candidatus Bathyarchaeia archaeon]
MKRSNVGALLRKELQGYFAQPLLYTVGAVFLLLAGYYFYSDLVFFVTFGFGQNIFENFFQLLFVDLRLVLLLTVPLLTMRLFAEERKLATIELLFTYPLSDLAIFLAKLLACIAAALALLGATWAFLAYLYHLQPFALGPLLAGYLGLVLLASSFVAWGAFVSSLTDSQVVAAMGTIGFLLLLWILSWNEAAANSETLPWLTRISMFDHFEGFSRGVIETKDLVYFVSVIVLTAAASLESLGARTWRKGAPLRSVIGMTGLVVALVFAGALAERDNVRFDLTPQRRYTLSPHARRIIEHLPSDVEVVAFVRAGDPRNREIADLLGRIAEVSPRVHARVVDVNKNPAMARRYGADVYGAVVVESGGKRRIFNSAREELLVGAMLEVTRPRPKVIYFVTGHDERSPLDRDRENGLNLLANELGNEAYEVREVDLSGGVPPDATVVVVAGGKAPWSPVDLVALEHWMDRGGRLLGLLDPLSAPTLAAWLAEHGVAPLADVVLDPENRLFGGEGVSIEARPVAAQESDGANDPAPRSIATTLDQGVILSLARSLQLDHQAVPLLESGAQSWATRSLDRAERGFAIFDGSRDVHGPLVVAAAREWPVEGSPARPARAVVVGDSDCATNAFIEMLGNKDFVQNAISWLADEDDLIALRPRRKEIGREQFFLSAGQAQTALLLGVVYAPGAALLAALAILARRRLKR